ncbi:MAG TPA: transcription elongation factor GreA [Syntrophaceae bacterium]|nr:transcription elongation factor GreA [Syntrophaceae bacterium]
MNRIPITREGYERLRKELEQLRQVERPQNIKAIEEARAHGDISENAEFHAAKERQSFIEGRIRDLEHKMSMMEIIESQKFSGTKVVFGCTVLVENLDTGEQVKYQLVGPDESDVKQGRLSVTSPLGKALIGREVGDVFQIQTPGGLREYELIDIL